MNLPNFWYGSCSYGLLWENHTLYAGKILIWRNLVHLRPFFGQNWQFWEFLTYNFQTLLWIFLIFGMEVVLMVFFEKIISISLENSDMAKFCPFKTKIWPFFGQNWLFWEFFTYNFQTLLWIFLIFGMELLWILTLSGEPIILCLVMQLPHILITITIIWNASWSRQYAAAKK